MKNSKKIIIGLFSMLLSTLGFVLIVQQTNWVFGIGLFLLFWGNNISLSHSFNDTNPLKDFFIRYE